METVLVIDDEVDLCRTLEKVLTKAGYRALWTADPEAAVDLVLKESPACILLDLKLGATDGITLLKAIREKDPRIPVIMLTAYETVKTAVQAMKEGAFYYLSKPFDNDELLGLVQKAVEGWRLKKQVEDLKGRLGEAEDLEAFMGTSGRIQEVIKLVRSVAATEVSVLLLGETGTGKELVARTIHQLSIRRDGSFVPVDCAAIPETLIESELFGHEKGAFTGASSLQKGKFEMADGGTVFLDEVGNIPAGVQSKLLRFLETHEFERIGGHRPLKTSVRVVAATNVDLARSSQSASGAAPAGGQGFRLDLFYRLNEFPIHLPPLRERKEDILLLCHKFLVQLQREVGKEIKEIVPEALERLMEYHFPGNVRELRNILKRAAVVAYDRIELADLPPEIRSREGGTFTQEIKVPVSYGLPLLEISRQASAQIEKQLILDALRRTKGHQGKAARLLGIGPKTLYNKIKELGIRNDISG